MATPAQRKRMLMFGGVAALVVVLYAFTRKSSTSSTAAGTQDSAIYDPSTGQWIDQATGAPINTTLADGTSGGGGGGFDPTVPDFTTDPGTFVDPGGTSPTQPPINVNVTIVPTPTEPAPPTTTTTPPTQAPPVPLTPELVLGSFATYNAFTDPPLPGSQGWLEQHSGPRQLATSTVPTPTPPRTTPQPAPTETPADPPHPATTASVPIETRPHVGTSKALPV